VVGPIDDLLSQLRAACASVAERARHVRIRREAIPEYAVSLPTQPENAAPAIDVNGDSVSEGEAESPFTVESGAVAGSPGADREDLAAFWITLDAVNFGSGWFPTIRKRPGLSGYRTIEAGLRNRFDRRRAWTAEELASVTAREVAATLEQDPDHELMALFARSLNDLGLHIAHEYGGRFESLVDAASGSAQDLVGRLAEWECFSDTSRYQELQLPFLKRAQITAADLHRAGVSDFDDLDRLTIFADNLVPHVLRLDGVLEFDAPLIERIEREELIEHDSPEEIEIRACAIHAVELIVAERPGTTAAHTDELLWRRGQEPAYKARPRHRSRCTAY
jgi:Potential Queuosine, Q, salvage protein family